MKYWAWCYLPVISALQEVEARRSGFEPSLYYVGKISLLHEHTHKYPNKTFKNTSNNINCLLSTMNSVGMLAPLVCVVFPSEKGALHALSKCP